MTNIEEEKIKTESTFAFAIGCFHFGLSTEPPFTFEITNYLTELEEALETIPTINNIEIKCKPDHHRTYEVTYVEPERLAEGGHFFPHPELDLRFDVYIPFRIQKELFPVGRDSIRTYTENFRVFVYYRHFAPVTFVETINPSQRPDPSEAIILVREHIIRELEVVKTDIQFDFLGPSPFHANCYLLPIDEQDGEDPKLLTAEYRKRRGYDEIVFRYRKSFFENINDARDLLYYLIRDEVAFFYGLKLDRVQAINDWFEIQEILEQLLHQEEVSRVKKLLSSLFLRGIRIRTLFTKTVEFEVDNILKDSLRRTSYSNVYSKDEPKFFQEYVDRELKDKTAYPTKQTIELAGFLEGQRSKKIELITLLLAAIIGGALGSLLTLILSR
jgi:hypothetical protein